MEPGLSIFVSRLLKKGALMTDPKVARVIAVGAAMGLEVRPVIFPEETRTASDAAQAVGCSLGQIVKSLVFQSGEEALLYLVSGANRVDEAKAMCLASVRALVRADAAFAKRATGFSIGATPPFGHNNALRIFMDEDLLAFEEVWAAAGRPDSVFPVTPQALASATRARVGPLAVS
jgi:prolyl-tRNA editing enzyme YbaK/EbsC (Cys-tRNA(Pro) deacylase)